MSKRRLIFTAHAKARCHDYGLNFRQIEKQFEGARIVNPPARVLRTNRMFHHRVASSIQYRWAYGVLYTVEVTGSSYRVLTLTPKNLHDL